MFVFKNESTTFEKINYELQIQLLFNQQYFNYTVNTCRINI